MNAIGAYRSISANPCYRTDFLCLGLGCAAVINCLHFPKDKSDRKKILTEMFDSIPEFDLKKGKIPKLVDYVVFEDILSKGLSDINSYAVLKEHISRIIDGSLSPKEEEKYTKDLSHFFSYMESCCISHMGY